MQWIKIISVSAFNPRPEYAIVLSPTIAISPPPNYGTTVRGTIENGSNSDRSRYRIFGLSFVGGFFTTFPVISIHAYEFKFLTYWVCTRLQQVLTLSLTSLRRMFFGCSSDLLRNWRSQLDVLVHNSWQSRNEETSIDSTTKEFIASRRCRDGPQRMMSNTSHYIVIIITTT
jgi:hypothetical protein